MHNITSQTIEIFMMNIQRIV